MSEINHEERRKGLGASEAAPACGLSRYATPLELYLQKIGEAPPVEETLPMRIGKALESVVIGEFERETGLTVSRQQERVVDPALPWRWATLDGMASDGALVEAKTAGSALDWGDASDAVPMEYLLQVHHGMAVTGAMVAYIPVILTGRQFKVYTVQRDDELVEMLTAREREFMDCVQRRQPPPVATLEDARRRWPKDTGESVIAADDIEAAWARLLCIKDEVKTYEAEADGLELQIKSAMGEASQIVGRNGQVLATWTAQVSRRLDTTALKAARPEIAAEFTREIPSRVFRPKKPKELKS